MFWDISCRSKCIDICVYSRVIKGINWPPFSKSWKTGSGVDFLVLRGCGGLSRVDRRFDIPDPSVLEAGNGVF